MLHIHVPQLIDPHGACATHEFFYNEFMKKIKAAMFSIFLLSTTSYASMAFYDSSNVSLGVHNAFKCGAGTSCSLVGSKFVITSGPSFSTGAFSGAVTVGGDLSGDGGDALYGFKQKQVAATATTITAAQCGDTFYNSGAVVINLPEASTAVGCRLTFVTANASNFDINPDDADQILVLTNAAGDAIRNATLGNTVVLQALNASQWVEISAVGTWSDIN